MNENKNEKVINLLKHDIAEIYFVRVVFALAILIFSVSNVYQFTLDEFNQNNDFATYLYLKLIINIIAIAIFIVTLISRKVLKNINVISFIFLLSFFYALSFNGLFKGHGWALNYNLIAITMLVYALNISTKRLILFTILSNAVVIYFSIDHFDNPVAVQFLILYLIVTLSLTLIKGLKQSFDSSIVQLDSFFEEIFNAMRDSVFLIDPISHNINFTNKTAKKAFGEVESIEKYILPEFQSTFKTALKMIFDFKGSWEGELQIQDKRGINYIGMVSLSYFKLKNQELIFMKITDISKLKFAEKQLKDVLIDIQEKNSQLEESKRAIMNILEDVVAERAEATAKEQKLSAVLQSITEGVIVLDINHRIYLYNDSVLRMLGLSAKDLDGKLFSEILDIRDEATDESRSSIIDKAFQGEVITSHVGSVLKRKDGKDLPVSESASPIFNDQKQVQRVVIVIRDATEQRKIDKMRSEFVSVVSHQLRTPLTSINWYVELLTDPDASTNLNDAQRESLQRIGEGNQRMIRLINDLLNVSRIETGRNFTITPEQTNYVQLIKEVIDEQQIIAEKKGMKINFDQKGITDITLNIDKEKIRQVIMNLLSNAVKYSHPNTDVLMRFGKDEKYIYLDIIDNGIGIPEEQQVRVFEKFFRADNAVTQQTEGTGLGMYIGQSIARAHDGDVTFYSKQNEGSTFTLKLPLKWEPSVESPTFDA